MTGVPVVEGVSFGFNFMDAIRVRDTVSGTIFPRPALPAAAVAAFDRHKLNPFNRPSAISVLDQGMGSIAGDYGHRPQTPCEAVSFALTVPTRVADGDVLDDTGTGAAGVRGRPSGSRRSVSTQPTLPAKFRRSARSDH